MIHKHAYLIIAHHEFLVLERLIAVLDDIRNEIYIHFDKKVKIIPTVTAKCAKIFVLSERTDVRWGNISQIACELSLFETALKNKQSSYSYLHLISGVHLPLKSQNEIHDYFKYTFPNNILSNMPTSDSEVDLKLKRYNFFTSFFIIPGFPNRQKYVQFLWKLLIRFQKILRIRQNRGENFIKAANWVSLTSSAATYLVNNKHQILKRYRYTLCGDEYFVPSELSRVMPNNLIFEENYLLTEFSGENTMVFDSKDYEKIISSPYLFARKFSSSDLDLVDKVCNTLNC